MSGPTTRRRAAGWVGLAAVLTVTVADASAPAAHPDPRARNLDLVATTLPS